MEEGVTSLFGSNYDPYELCKWFRINLGEMNYRNTAKKKKKMTSNVLIYDMTIYWVFCYMLNTARNNSMVHNILLLTYNVRRETNTKLNLNLSRIWSQRTRLALAPPFMSCVTQRKPLDLSTSFPWCTKWDNMYEREWCKGRDPNKIRVVKVLCGLLRNLHMLLIIINGKRGKWLCLIWDERRQWFPQTVIV